MATRLKLLFFFFCIPFILFAQAQDIRFEHITMKQGLSSNEVFCVLQDKKGFMWFGTRDGLNKYDGNKIKIYKNDPGDFKSISCNMIETIFEDSDGELWIGTWGGGLNKYDRESDKFIHFKHSSKNKYNLCNNIVTCIYEDNKSNLWVGTINGLSYLVRSQETLNNKNEFKLDQNHTVIEIINHLADNYILSINEDLNGLVWISTNNKGITQFDPQKNTFANHKMIDGLDFTEQSGSVIYVDHDSKEEKLLIGSNNQLVIYNLNTCQKKIHLCPENVRIQDIQKVREKKYWLGTVGDGIYIFNDEDEKFTVLRNQYNFPGSLSNNYVTEIFVDICDRVWAATSGGGINRFDPGKRKFTLYKLISQKGTILYHTSSIFEDIAENRCILWIGTTDQGLVKFDRITGKIERYESILGRINCIYQAPDELNILWLGTDENGLYRFDKNNEKFTQHRERRLGLNGDPNNFKKYSNYWLRSLMKDQSGNLWLGAGWGLFKFNRENYSIIPYVHIPNDPNSIRGNSLNTLIEDNNGIIWIGTRNSGLNRFDPKTNLFKFYLNNPRDSLSLSNDFVNVLCNGKSDELWVGTINGLNRFDKKDEIFIDYHTKYKLPGENIKGILEDNNGCLWISTNNGLLRFNTDTETFHHYDDRDGLQGQEFNRWCSHKSRSGEMFFGGENGFNAFYPEDIKDNTFIPPIAITDFQIFNKSVQSGNKSLFHYSDKEIDKITLTYDQSVFSFEFAALDFTEPTKNQYAYKMEGVDPNWVYTDATRRYATYTQLDPGEYIFRVKGSNNDRIWNEEGTSIKIIITPPWWKTTWAYAVYILLFALTLYALRTYDQKRQRLKHDLDLEHLHAEKLEEVDRMKSRFFANISHEFRTPLTLIKGPVNQMLSGEFKGNMKEQFKMILRNSDRLLKLINQLLDLSKLESGRMSLQVAKTDLLKFIKGLALSFSSLAESKKITLKFNTEDDSIMGYIDRDKLEKIINNLLSNAFKFTPVGGDIVVNVKKHPPESPLDRGDESVSPLVKGDTGGCKNANSQFQVPNSDFAEIIITNTGPDIPPDRLDKIFDRFYQVDDTVTRHQEGAGIGLALTKELVELHHGTIEVQSGRGTLKTGSATAYRALGEEEAEAKTTFTVNIPISKEHFKPEEIVEDLETADRKPETGKHQLYDSNLDKDSGYQIPDVNKKSNGLDRPAVSGLQPPLVLIVEDNLDVTTYIRSFLDQDYRIITAINGKEGCQKALEKYPDLIISDVMMPEMDGFELCHKLKSDEKTSHIPVILLTAKADLDSRIEGLEFGADDYISKPFEARELKARASNLIEQRQKLREKFSQAIEIKPGEIATSSMDEQFITRLLDVFEDHVSESDFSTEDFAREVGMSRMHLNRKLQALTNQPTHEFIRLLRLKRAAQLLKQTTGSVSEIAYMVGFNNTSHFAKVFRKIFGQSPSVFSENSKKSLQ